MSLSLSKRRPTSLVPQVNMFNNWLNNQQKKVSTTMMMKTRASRAISTSLYRSTIVNDPQIKSPNDKFYYTNTNGFTTVTNSNHQHHNRTYSSYKNTQSRLVYTKDELKDIAQQISYLVERAKKTRLDIKMIKKQYLIDIERKQQQLKQKIFGLKKMVSYSMKQQQQRGKKIKTQVSNIQQDYSQVKHKMNLIDEKLTLMENQCGFATLRHKLYK